MSFYFIIGFIRNKVKILFRYFVNDLQMIGLFKYLELFMFESELVSEPLLCFKVF